MVVFIDTPFEGGAKARFDVQECVSHLLHEGPFTFPRSLVRFRYRVVGDGEKHSHVRWIRPGCVGEEGICPFLHYIARPSIRSVCWVLEVPKAFRQLAVELPETAEGWAAYERLQCL